MEVEAMVEQVGCMEGEAIMTLPSQCKVEFNEGFQ